MAPALGRDFTAAEEKFGGPNAVLISDRLWRRRFGADPGAIGKGLRVGSTAFTIVGVAPGGLNRVSPRPRLARISRPYRQASPRNIPRRTPESIRQSSR